ncbi:MAG: metallophosphoesterase, partial [Bacteroidales bacterium]|nr:metallophosphoesterase [Bacteroidales bacterium]
YTIYGAYWLVPFSLFVVAAYALFFGMSSDFRSNKMVHYMMAVVVLFYLPKLFIVVFQVVEDFSKVAAWATKKISNPQGSVYSGADKISRSVFIGRMGLFIASIPFASVIYGIVKGRFNFTVNRKTLYFDHLPEAFDGLKILQFSDFHAGSLIGEQEKFSEAINIMNSQNADLIVFTGDMVNSKADELDDWIALLSKLEVKQGKYSILGNHDYGDYHHWDSEEEKIVNLELLKQYHAQMGFKLMLNDTHIFEKDGQKIALLGVENWGEKPFPQLGRLDVVMEKAKEVPFKVLLSHDPTHWDYKVLNKTDVALTLSGHTHGMQMAINIAGYSWSPVSLKYPRWKGLYSENNQHLYVNIGLGYIGFPGRVGTDPEITVIELKSKNVG